MYRACLVHLHSTRGLPFSWTCMYISMYVCISVCDRERERERERECVCVCEIRSGANNLIWRRTSAPIKNTHTYTSTSYTKSKLSCCTIFNAAKQKSNRFSSADIVTCHGVDWPGGIPHRNFSFFSSPFSDMLCNLFRLLLKEMCWVIWSKREADYLPCMASILWMLWALTTFPYPSL